MWPGGDCRLQWMCYNCFEHVRLSDHLANGFGFKPWFKDKVIKIFTMTLPSKPRFEPTTIWKVQTLIPLG